MTRTPTLSGLIKENERLYRCINAAMDHMNPMSGRPEEFKAWWCLLDALEGREPREKLSEEERR